MNCPKCNTPNPEDARWCGLCLEKFVARPAISQSYAVAPTPIAPPPPPPPVVPSSPAEPQSYLPPSPPHLFSPPPSAPPDDFGGSAAPSASEFAPPAAAAPPNPPVDLGQFIPPAPPALRKVGDQLVWTCPSCSRENSFAHNNCVVCGASLYDMFRTPVETHQAASRDPNLATALSLIPGGGHFYLGRIAQGFIRLTLGAWWLLSAIFISGANKLLDFVQYMFWIAFIGLVVVSALDARALAEDPDAPQLLTGKVVRYAALTLAGAAVLGLLTALIVGR